MQIPSLSFKKKCRVPTGAATGQSLVEFAVSLPVLLVILIGVVDLGRLYFSYISVVNAAREGARYGAGHPTDNTNILARSRSEVDGNIVGPADLTISVACPSGCTPGDNVTPGVNNPIVVTVSYPFHLITTYVFGGAPIQLQTSAQMVIYAQ